MIPKVLLTRPRADAQRFAEALCPIDADILISPIIEIEHQRVASLPGTADLVLTSANALGAVAHLDLAGRRAFCVGDHTARAAADLGLSSVSAGGAAADLVKLIAAQGPAHPLLYLRGRRVSMDMSKALTEHGFDVVEQIVYRQIDIGLSDEALDALKSPNLTCLPIFSPRAAQSLSTELGAARELIIVAMSPAVASAVNGPSEALIVMSEHPDLPSMVKATKDAVSRG